jgi:hypothetical protein
LLCVPNERVFGNHQNLFYPGPWPLSVTLTLRCVAPE